jgi:undecaprenyl-diphosphatase
MSILEGALLGMLQGLAEFLPISSSGHLNLFQALLHTELDNQLLFNILLHVGTLIAVAIVFWKDWLDMLLHPIRNKTLLLLFVASLPALAAKILFDGPLDYAETHNTFLGLCFLLTSVMLLLTQVLSTRQKNVEKDHVGFWEAIVMGCLQAVGMLPGISRSGSTIFGGVLARVNREAAAKFSFMMSAPAIVGSLLVEGKDALEAGISFGSDLPAILIGMVVAGVVGYFSIRFFLKLIANATLNGFALYTAIVGVCVLIFQAMGIMTDPQPVDAALAALRNLC